MRSAPTLLAAAEDKRFHEPSLLLPNMHPVLPNINSRMRHAARSSTRLSCRNRCEQCVRDARKAERRRDGRRRETTGAPESILSPLVTRSLPLSTHLYLQSVSGRWSISLQQVAPPTKKVDDSSACPTSYPNQQR